MSLKDYIKHYIAIPDSLFFFLVSFLVVLAVNWILLFFAKRNVKSVRLSNRHTALYEYYNSYMEKYYELMFSSTCILFFTGLFFTFDYPYLNSRLPYTVQAFWQNWRDFILLGLIVFSILINSMIDHIFVPLSTISKDERNTLRLTGMLYMLIIFLYIKFIYEDSNYDEIVIYFLTMVIGRFVYFDADLKDFFRYVKDIVAILPYLALVLLTTAILTAYGFGSGYLLRTNGVVLSTFIAHFFAVINIFLITRIGISRRSGKKAAEKIRRQKEDM